MRGGVGGKEEGEGRAGREKGRKEEGRRGSGSGVSVITVRKHRNRDELSIKALTGFLVPVVVLLLWSVRRQLHDRQYQQFTCSLVPGSEPSLIPRLPSQIEVWV